MSASATVWLVWNDPKGFLVIRHDELPGGGLLPSHTGYTVPTLEDVRAILTSRKVAPVDGGHDEKSGLVQVWR